MIRLRKFYAGLFLLGSLVANAQSFSLKQAVDYASACEAEAWDGAYERKFAELIVQGCADFVRENYDHEAAESIAWCMEINYGLHGDYA